jgi:hypothetical protein
MKNLTLSIDEDVLEEARKRALERGTSVNQMVREYLEDVSGMNEKRHRALQKLKETWKASEIEVGEITWDREQLHGR